jgi:transposase
VGLDVHAETIAVAIAENGRRGEVRSLGTIPNRPDSIRKLLKKLKGPEGLRFCYEAGPTGYAVYWQLTGLGAECEVVAPTLVPKKPGERVKTDRLDAEKLARCYRAGDLTPVWVPDAAHEALRDLVRAREAAKKDHLRARHQLSKFLLRRGERAPVGVRNWTLKHRAWLKTVTFDEPVHDRVFRDYVDEVDHQAERIKRLEQAIDDAVETVPEQMRAVIEALQALRGVAKLSAVTIVAETGPLSRFDRPAKLMSYAGLVSSEHSSGASRRQGAITKTGNAHLRRIVGEAAWSCRYKPAIAGRLKQRQMGLSEEIKEIAWKAQHRLHRRYVRLVSRGKPSQVAVTAVGRELLGFIWAIGVHVEREQAAKPSTQHRAA